MPAQMLSETRRMCTEETIPSKSEAVAPRSQIHQAEVVRVMMLTMTLACSAVEG